MKALGNGWKLGTLACSDLKCYFLWDCRKMSVLLHGAFLLKGKKIFMVIQRAKLIGASLSRRSVHVSDGRYFYFHFPFLN